MSKYSIFFTIMFLVIISIISVWLNNEVKKELNIEEKKLTNTDKKYIYLNIAAKKIKNILKNKKINKKNIKILS